jgi:5-methylcytosine-specific restriction protein B
LTVQENTARRAFETIRVLSESPEGRNTRLGIWETVQQRIPLSDEELESTSSKSQPRGMTNFTFASDDLVNAGYIEKVRRGVWEVTESGREALTRWTDPVDFYADVLRVSRAVRAARSESRDEALASTIVPPDDRAANIRRISGIFVREGLTNLGSVFVPGREVWRTEVVNELIVTFVGQPLVEGDRFGSKLAEQLRDVSDDARLLMAEIAAWQVLPLSQPGELKKRERVQQILDLMDQPVVIPSEIDDAFRSYSFNPGRGMAQQIYRGLSIMIEGIKRWIELKPEERAEALENPWAWRDFVGAIPGTPFATQRNELLYLVHPATFGEVVSGEHRESIRNAFIGEVPEGSTGDIDQDFLAVTIALQVKERKPALYYEEPLRSRWIASATAADPSAEVDGVALPTLGLNDRADFPTTSAEFASALHIDREWLSGVLRLVERRKQVIFYGPPGTGKTYLAQAIAKYVTDSTSGSTQIVQFHPTYSYEDFFEGFRPVMGTDSQQLGFALRRGPLRRLADQAAANPEANYFLVIDEINRGNLAKIFGELYYLLEYRDREITLLYSDEPFTLPSNIFVLGTMNTADRSIAMLDAAMRRRFAFIELHPDQKPVDRLLVSWMNEQSFSDDRVGLLAELNRRIQDYDAKVGPSFLMRDFGDEGIDSVWTHEILPLLSEHHYADGLDVDREYGLESLRRGLTKTSSTAVQEVPAERDVDDS